MGWLRDPRLPAMQQPLVVARHPRRHVLRVRACAWLADAPARAGA